MLKKILYYLNPMTMFSAREKEKSTNMRFMHGINRISVYMFILALLILFFRYAI